MSVDKLVEALEETQARGIERSVNEALSMANIELSSIRRDDFERLAREIARAIDEGAYDGTAAKIRRIQFITNYIKHAMKLGWSAAHNPGKIK